MNSLKSFDWIFKIKPFLIKKHFLIGKISFILEIRVKFLKTMSYYFYKVYHTHSSKTKLEWAAKFIWNYMSIFNWKFYVQLICLQLQHIAINIFMKLNFCIISMNKCLCHLISWIFDYSFYFRVWNTSFRSFCIHVKRFLNKRLVTVSISSDFKSLVKHLIMANKILRPLLFAPRVRSFVHTK